MGDPSAGCHVSNTSLKRRRLFLCPTEKSENTEFPLVEISTTLVTNSSFFGYGRRDPFFSFSPCLFYVSKWVGERSEPSSCISTICEHLSSLTSIWVSSSVSHFSARPQPSLLSLKLRMRKKKCNYFTDAHWGQLLQGILLVQDGKRNQP